jgi:hypothetical protein
MSCSTHRFLNLEGAVGDLQHAAAIYKFGLFEAHTVGTESIQTPLNFSLFVSLQPFSKNQKSSFYFSVMYTQHPILDRKKQKCRNFCKFIKKEKLKYHMVISIQTLCRDPHM